MQKRQVKKQVTGIWQDVKWKDIKKGDLFRIYERGYGYHDGRTNTFIATADAEIACDGEWGIPYEHGILTDTALINVHDNVRKSDGKVS